VRDATDSVSNMILIDYFSRVDAPIFSNVIEQLRPSPQSANIFTFQICCRHDLVRNVLTPFDLRGEIAAQSDRFLCQCDRHNITLGGHA
jgi:hypothetical protein